MMNTVVAVAFVCVAGVVSVWVVMRLLPGLTGWRQLATAYPAREPAEVIDKGGPVSIGTMKIGGYNNCIMWQVDADHLHLRMMKLFSAGHAPMSIPFAAMSFPPNKGGRYVPVDLEIGRRLTLPLRMVSREIELREQIAESELESGSPNHEEA